MEINKILKVDVYSTNVKIVLTDEMDKTLKKYFKKFKVPFDDGYYWGMFFSDPDVSNYYLFLNTKKLTLDTIVHESYHACCKILKDRGVGMEDEEPMAYLMGYFCEALMKIVIGSKINISNGAN